MEKPSVASPTRKEPEYEETVAKLERDIIAERVKAGLRKAKENGKTLGRPKGTALDVEKIRGLRSDGLSLQQIATELNTSKSFVWRMDDA